jgi:hypothetical protein
MIVKAWKGGKSKNGRYTYGIDVGKENRARYFSREWKTIEVELDGQVRLFNLSGSFWADCAEFRGAPHIRNWLERHHTTNWPIGKQPEFELAPMGGARFRLVP